MALCGHLMRLQFPGEPAWGTLHPIFWMGETETGEGRICSVSALASEKSARDGDVTTDKHRFLQETNAGPASHVSICTLGLCSSRGLLCAGCATQTPFPFPPSIQPNSISQPPLQFGGAM